MIYQVNNHPKEAGGLILISDKVEFKITLVKWDKGHFVLIKGAIHQKQITIINLYTPNISARNFLKDTLKELKVHVDFSTVVMREFYTTFWLTDRSSKQKINKEILELNYNINQKYIINVCRISHPTTTQCTFFSAVHGIFSKINHILGYKQASANIRK
jgi:hypothetical protein